MAKTEKDQLLEHDFDGIKELDNFMPKWWKWLFILSIVFSIGYVLHYHVFKTGDLQNVEYFKEMNPEWSQANLKLVGPSIRYKSPYSGTGMVAVVASSEMGGTFQGEITGEPITIALLTDSENIEKGKSIYTTNCVACHGVNGEGLIGPSFCDSYWIHGGAIEDLVHLINVGVAAKGMIPWDKTLTPLQILQVASYILTFEGTNPPIQKAPEGEIYIRS